jgi:hypothetical protein
VADVPSGLSLTPGGREGGRKETEAKLHENQKQREAQLQDDHVQKLLKEKNIYIPKQLHLL